MAVNFSNVVHTGSTQYTSIGLPRYIEFQFDTDFPTANITNSQRFAIKPAQWVNPTYLPEVANVLPSQGYWDLLTDGSTALAIDYDMNWVAGANANNQRNGKLSIRFVNNAGFIQVVLKWYWINVFDTSVYLTTPLSCNKKLLKDSVNNPVDLDNSQVDVYSGTREYRLGFWWIEASARSFVRLSANDDVRFYGEYPGEWENPNFYNDNCSSGTVFQEPFIQSFEIDKLIVDAVTRVNWFLVRVDNTDNSIYWQDNNEIFNANYTTFPLGAPYLDWDLTNNGIFLAVTNLILVAGSTYKTTVTVDNSLLTVGATYRFIVIIETATDSYSFIADEIKVDACKCLVPPVIMESSLTNFVYNAGDRIITSPQIRLKSFLQLDTTNYNADRGLIFGNSLKTVDVVFYGIDAINTDIIHIYERYTINRQPTNTFNVPTSNPTGAPKQWEFVVTNTSLSINHDFRVRYESNLQNLKSFYNPDFEINYDLTPPSLGSLTDMNWTLKTVKILYQITVENASYLDVFNIIQEIQVTDYAIIDDTLLTPDSMKFVIYDFNGIPIEEICGQQTITICNSAENATDGQRFNSGLDIEPFTVSTFIEDDGTGCDTSPIPLIYLNNTDISSQDCTYTALQACSTINLPDILGKILRFVAFKLDENCNEIPCPTCCVACEDVLWKGHYNWNFNGAPHPHWMWNWVYNYAGQLRTYDVNDYAPGLASQTIYWIYTPAFATYEPFNPLVGARQPYGLGFWVTSMKPMVSLGGLEPDYLANPTPPTAPPLIGDPDWPNFVTPDGYNGSHEGGMYLWPKPLKEPDDDATIQAYLGCIFTMRIQVLEVDQVGWIGGQMMTGLNFGGWFIDAPGIYEFSLPMGQWLQTAFYAVNLFGLAQYPWTSADNTCYCWYGNAFFGNFKMLDFFCAGEPF